MAGIMQGRRGGLNGARALGRVGWLAAAAFAMLAGCAAPDRQAGGPIAQTPASSGGSSGARVDMGGPVKVTLLAPLGSADAAVAAEARGLADGARLALGPGSGIALEVRDTLGTPAGAAAAARDAVAGGAALLIGPLYAASAVEAGAAAAAAGVNVIAFSNTPSAAGGNVWLGGLLTQAEADRIIGHAAAQGVRTVSLYHPDTAEGDVARAAAQAAAGRIGVRLAPVTAYPRSFEGIQDSSAGHARAHKEAGAQAVLMPDRGQGLQAAASFMAYHGVSARDGLMLGFAAWEDPAILTESALLGGRFAAPDPERMAAFAARFEAAHGRAPSALAWVGHDAAAAAAQMLARAKGRGDATPFDREAITDPAGFQGAAGPFRFTGAGLNERALAVVEVARGGFVTREPAAASLAGPGA